jgi:hypothetical protein
LEKNNFSDEDILTSLDEGFGIENKDDPEYIQLMNKYKEKKYKAPTQKASTVSLLKNFNLTLHNASPSSSSSSEIRVRLLNAKKEEKTSPAKNVIIRTPNPSPQTTNDLVVSSSSVGTAVNKSLIKQKVQQKMKQMKENEVLDVSKVDEKGNGMKKIQRPSFNDKSRHGISDLSIVSSSEEAFELILECLDMSDRKGEYANTKVIISRKTPLRKSALTV